MKQGAGYLKPNGEAMDVVHVVGDGNVLSAAGTRIKPRERYLSRREQGIEVGIGHISKLG